MHTPLGSGKFVPVMEKLQAKARARYAFAEFLGGIGKRCTPERLLILDLAIEQRKPFTANTLLKLCQESHGIKVCRATLFNTLPLLVQCGLLRRNAHDRDVEYESIRSRGMQSARQHLICNVCGKIHHLRAPDLAAWVASQSFRGFSGEPDSAVVYVYGQCSRCRRKTSLKSKNIKP